MQVRLGQIARDAADGAGLIQLKPVPETLEVEVVTALLHQTDEDRLGVSLVGVHADGTGVLHVFKNLLVDVQCQVTLFSVSETHIIMYEDAASDSYSWLHVYKLISQYLYRLYWYVYAILFGGH